ncbi:MAG TPA: hypothetical protein VMN39_09775, partial [Longimicrobiaceae bacterium]|nr:hypothetical protein [Longimicrobiaceae bacterium]
TPSPGDAAASSPGHADEPSPGPALAPSPGNAPAPVALDLTAVRRAWRSLVEEGSRVTGGMGVILRAADLGLVGESEISVGFPPASPALERLSESPRRRAIEASLSGLLGRPVTVRIVTSDHSVAEPQGQRITAESARQERLRRLVAEEPLLGAAVREWDLELLD